MSLKRQGRKAKPGSKSQASTLRTVRAACYALGLSGAAMVGAGYARAQQTAGQPAPDVPALRHRSAQNPNEATTPTVATGHTYLTDTAEGEYPWKSWRGDGEIEMYFEHGRLQGYITEPLDAQSQSASELIFDFATTHIDGDALSFTTRQVHGAWYSFTGHLERGLVAAPSQSGYYLLTGTLTEHGGEVGEQSHTVSLPREPDGN